MNFTALHRSEPNVIDICNDKWKTYQFLENHGFFVPKSYLDVNTVLKEINIAIIKKKIAMRSGETDCTITVDWKTGKECAKKISAELGHIGNLDVDVFEVNTIPYILEMNARFGGCYPFSHLAGVNLPKALVYWVARNETDEKNLQEKIGVMGQKDIDIICYCK